MSILDAFEKDSEEMITPSDRVSRVPELAPTTIIVFEKHNLEPFLEQFPHQKIAEIDMGTELPVYRLQYQDKAFNVFLSAQNSSAAGECLEVLIAMGSRKFVVYGSCGVLDDSITSEKLIVPISAYRDEGMSYHYLPAGDFVEITGSRKTAKRMDELHVPYIKTITWTTDAIFRETKNKVQRMKNLGCRVVEMECASIEAVSRFRGAEVLYFLYAEDSLGGVQWDPRIMGNVKPNAARRYADLALTLAIQI